MLNIQRYHEKFTVHSLLTTYLTRSSPAVMWLEVADFQILTGSETPGRENAAKNEYGKKSPVPSKRRHAGLRLMPRS